MYIHFSEQNCLTRYNANALRGETGREGQYILCHTDVLKNDKHVFVNDNTLTFFKKNTLGYRFHGSRSTFISMKTFNLLNDYLVTV